MGVELLSHRNHISTFRRQQQIRLPGESSRCALSSPILGVVLYLVFSHFDEYKLVPHCGFNLLFPDR